MADGTPIVYDHENPNNPLNSVSRHMHFVVVAMPDLTSTPDLSDATMTRTLSLLEATTPTVRTRELFCNVHPGIRMRSEEAWG